MGSLKINQALVNESNAEQLIKLCPFNAISLKNGELDISSACKMCKMCVRKGPSGVIEYVEGDVTATDKSLWRGVCVYADHERGRIHRVTYELIGKARELASVTGHPVYALIMGYNVSECARDLLRYGVDKVFVYDDEGLKDFRIEPYTATFCDFIDKEKPSSILVGATNLGRQLAPRVAARCRAGLTADCTVLEMKKNTDLVQIRPAFGGNIMAQIISPNQRPQFCTVRYKVFSEPKPQDTASGEIVRMQTSAEMMKSDITVLDVVEKPRETDISESDVIVAIGRGASSETMIAAASELCELIGGTLACTRPLVESGIMDAKRQIGLSGRTVKPKFIICIGISGAVQFSAGMRASDCIVAINTDAHAPIFDVAHYGIVGDASEIIPMLINKIKEARSDV